MTREETLRDIEDTLGFVPTFMKSIPEDFLPNEWELYKRLELEETTIPGKFKELIGLGASAATKCPFCIAYHTELARMHGASDDEIREAVYITKMTTGWSSQVHGVQLDLDEFRDEVRRILQHVQAKEQRKAA